MVVTYMQAEKNAPMEVDLQGRGVSLFSPFLASQDALEVMRVTESLTEWALVLTLLM